MRRALLAVASLMAITACTVVTGLRVPPPDAGPDVPLDSGVIDPCPHALPPPAPERFVGGDDKEFLVALSEIDFHIAAPSPPAFGFDIDGVCTCSDQPESCVSKVPHCDDSAGRDNAGREIFKSIDSFFDLQKHVNTLLAKGMSGLLIRVRNYNGLPDDSNVSVSLYLSNGPIGPLADGGIGGVPPRFDANDMWTIDQSQLVGPPEAKDSRDTKTGYVAGGVLVVKVDARIRLLDGPTTTFSSGVVTARILQGADGTRLEGVIGGRLPASDVLRSISWSTDPVSGVPFCEVPGFEDLLTPMICDAADLTVDPSLDRTGAPCTALSSALTFKASPASFGPVVTITPSEEHCADAGILVCNP